MQNNKQMGRRWAVRIVTAFVALFAILVLIVMFFPWDVLRGPVNRYVSEKTGRTFEITRHLDVDLGWRSATVKLDGIEFANPDWARDPYLVRAERAELDLRLWPLLGGKVVIPRLMMVAPAVGLQMEKDGRRTWALGKDTSDEGTVPTIGQIQVDNGSVDFLAPYLGVDLHAEVAYDSGKGEMPLSYRIKGTYKRQPLTAQGRTGNVMQLAATGQPPFPLEIDARAGQTRLKAAGTVAALSGLDGIDATFDLRGQSLGDLYGLLGIALPQTSPYALSGQLGKRASLWEVKGLKGKLGLSDIGGEMQFDQGPKVPMLSGTLRSQVMDMDDLGPLIGLPPTARSANAVEGVAPPPTVTQVKRPQRNGQDKVLPTATLDFERLGAMNADVRYSADRIRNVREVPLDKGSVHVKLQDKVLTLDPLDLGVAAGKLSGAIRIDAAKNPADIRASLDLRGMQLARLFPKLETTGNSVGKFGGRINLSGSGNSVAGWLGGASGDVAVLSGKGQFGNLLPVFATLVGGDIIKFLLRGDRNVELRCAAVAFDVNKGLMTGRTLVVDTTNAVFTASGQANLANETLDFVVRPEPKSKSILSIRTPLVVSGTFGDPKGGVEVAPLAGRGLAALALGAINPLLALAATIETGPGEDADCKGVLSDANRPTAGAAANGAARAKGAKQP
ncbi:MULTISPECIES: AsmA family protein [unclassified Variovorax]|uniref:AsmA family protein n=1 Tax=unclassified Variovorax TaxID=663243 RepID=UPI002577F9BD|nr:MULTISPECIES: AsmA family protein [unclassified Variovorax]MDM0088500.1 AsmA family protein [Variovorax sp. J22G40]MDM0146573.1 AsmA family protein [Variovorax sp. J2P1-31]